MSDRKSKYQSKFLSGTQMYGGQASGGKSCCAHDRVPIPVSKDRYWWGEQRSAVFDTVEESDSFFLEGEV